MVPWMPHRFPASRPMAVTTPNAPSRRKGTVRTSSGSVTGFSSMVVN